VTTLRTKSRPASRPTLSANLEGKPAAQARPKLGALGTAAKAGPGHGTIKLKPSLPVAALDSVEIKKEAKAKPSAKARAKQAVGKPAPRPKTTAGPSATRAAASQ
jgi:hypothetical protein